MKKSVLFVHCSVVIIFITLGLFSRAVAQNLDNTFDSDGKVLVNLGSLEEYGSDVAVQADGKIISVGFRKLSIDNTVLLVCRHHPDGSLDATFGTGGILTHDIYNWEDRLYAIELMDDGRILIGGSVFTTGFGDKSGVLIRLEENGAFDNTFGTNGIVFVDFQGIVSQSHVEDIAIQTDGKIVVGGAAYNYMTLMRLHPDGTVDSSFADDGVIFIDPNQQNMDMAKSVKIQTDGKIVAVGTTRDDMDKDIGILRFETNGDFDLTFGNNGFASYDLNYYYHDYADDVLLCPDGKMLIAGSRGGGSYSHACVLRLDQNGAIDTSFGNLGMSFAYSVGSDYAGANQVLFNVDQQVVLISGFFTSDADCAVSVFDYEGIPDDNFNFTGTVTYNYLGETFTAGAIQSDGKIIGVGSFVNSSGNSDLGLLRYEYTPTDISVENELANDHIKVFPNPSNGNVYIDMNGSSEYDHLQVINTLGVSVYQKEIIENSPQLSLSLVDLTKGIYFIRLSDSTGKSRAVKWIKN